MPPVPTRRWPPGRDREVDLSIHEWARGASTNGEVLPSHHRTSGPSVYLAPAESWPTPDMPAGLDGPVRLQWTPGAPPGFPKGAIGTPASSPAQHAGRGEPVENIRRLR